MAALLRSVLHAALVGWALGAGETLLRLAQGATRRPSDAFLLVGWTGDDTISGGPDVDRIFGDEGDDVLDGLGADDFIDSGPGADSVNKQAGDTLVEGLGGDTVNNV